MLGELKPKGPNGLGGAGGSAGQPVREALALLGGRVWRRIHPKGEDRVEGGDADDDGTESDGGADATASEEGGDASPEEAAALGKVPHEGGGEDDDGTGPDGDGATLAEDFLLAMGVFWE